MKKVLLKDIIIPAGTVFDDAPYKCEYSKKCYVEAVIGLTKDTSGYITYQTSDDLKEWFAELRA